MRAWGVDWGHKLSYGSQLDSGANNPDANNPNGYRWFVEQMPELGRDASGNVQVITIINDGVWFTKSSSTYVARYFSLDTLTENTTTKEFTYNDGSGRSWKFFSFDSTVAVALRGKFKNFTDAHGTTYAGTYNGSNQLISVIFGGTPSVSFNYSYYTSGANSGKLQYVTVLRGTTNLRRLSFTYYINTDEHGTDGDLRSQSLEQWNASGTVWEEITTYYYRYFTEGGSGGFQHGLQYILHGEGFRQAALWGNSQVPAQTIDQISDADLGRFADNRFEYDANNRVIDEYVAGPNRTSSSPNARYSYAYDTSTYVAGTQSDRFNKWVRGTTETLPDNSTTRQVFTNYAGQIILEDFTEPGAGGRRWFTYSKYDSEGRPTELITSEAITGYATNTNGDIAVTISSNSGLIRLYVYYTTTNSGTGAVAGLLNYEGVKKGSGGSVIKTRELTYENYLQGSRRICPVRAEMLFQSDVSGGSVASTTTYIYTLFTGSLRFEQLETALPAISATENGSGTSNRRIERYDQYGQLLWRREERGFLTRFRYDNASGGRTQRIDDVATGQITDSPAVPSGWSTPAGGGLHLVTDYILDHFGRSTQELGPVHDVSLAGVNTPLRRTSWTVYRDSAGEVRRAKGYITQASSSVTALIEPIMVRRTDDNRRATETIVTRRAAGVTGALTSTENVSDQTRWVRWSQWTYDNNSTTANKERVYFVIPTSGAGTSTGNYSETAWQYGIDARRLRELTPGGTIRRWTYDVRKRVTGLWIGTDDTGATEQDPSDGGSNDMRQVEGYQYDNGGVGSNKVTELRLPVDANISNDRVLSFAYDWRNRLTSVTGDLNQRNEYQLNNQGRVTRVEERNGTGGILLGRMDIFYDLLGRIYRITRFAVNVSDGTVGNGLSSNRWYDASGNLIKLAPPGSKLLIKHRYDGVSRRTVTFKSVNPSDDTYAEASSVSTDTVVEQEEVFYDSASNINRVAARLRFHDETTQGALASPTISPKARVSHTAYYSDALGRAVAKASFGTNGGANFTRPVTVPSRSDTVLVDSTDYGWSLLNAGESFNRSESVTNYDPKSIPTRLRWNSAHWIVETVKDLGGISKTTQVTYNSDGNPTEVLQLNSTTGNQSTKFLYGATLAESQIASKQLRRSTIYPDSLDVDISGTDQIKLKRNRQGQVTEYIDQAGTVHVLDYDKRGRLIHDRATVLGPNINGAVRRISRTYEARGLPDRITSTNNSTVGSGTVVNELQFEYNDFGNITSEWQEQTGAVNPVTSPRLQYTYANGSANHVRQISMTYPSPGGRVITFDYGTSAGLNDLLSRVALVQDGSTSLVEYSYLGIDVFVRASYSMQPGIELTYIKQGAEPNGDAGDQYSGLDRFGRVVDQRWIKSSDGSARVRVQYGFDRNGNRLFREDLVASSGQDELYTYDAVNQLTQRGLGTLNPTRTALTGTPVGEEFFTLDPTGNWRGPSSGYVVRTNGAVSLDQNRTTNRANEIQSITATTGTNWFDPTYDSAGNMTGIPQPAALASGFTARYDAWNRLAELISGMGSLGAYRYDGIGRRVSKLVGVQTRRFYYTRNWQIVEERIGSSSSADRQFVWGRRYVDDLIVRDVGSQRLYVLHDYFHPVALSDTSGSILERYGYDAYGEARIMDSAFSARSSSSYAWETRFAAYRWDSESRLLLARFRLIHPILGTWSSRDLLKWAEKPNLYEVVSNRPINAVDPLGLCEEYPWEPIEPYLLQPDDLRSLWDSGQPKELKLNDHWSISLQVGISGSGSDGFSGSGTVGAYFNYGRWSGGGAFTEKNPFSNSPEESCWFKLKWSF